MTAKIRGANAASRSSPFCSSFPLLPYVPNSFLNRANEGNEEKTDLRIWLKTPSPWQRAKLMTRSRCDPAEKRIAHRGHKGRRGFTIGAIAGRCALCDFPMNLANEGKGMELAEGVDVAGRAPSPREGMRPTRRPHSGW